ncbi:MAG: hypothetical protein J2P49_07135 [Methylocapsa sp.]|nr:hypothetical protein [Methylocapsa sp.]
MAGNEDELPKSTEEEIGARELDQKAAGDDLRDGGSNKPHHAADPDEAPLQEPDREPSAPAPPLAAAEARPRLLFPALALTALAGALLGIGGSYGLRILAAPPRNAAPSGERLDELASRLDAVESKAAAASSAERTAMGALEARVAAAEDAARGAGDLSKTVEADLHKLAAPPPAPKEETSGPPAPVETVDLGPVEARLAALEQKTQLPDLGPVEARIAALEQKLSKSGLAAPGPKTSVRANPEREMANAGETARAQKIAILTGNLLRRLDHGDDFSADLTALENLGVPQPALAPLRAVASPVLSERELAAQFGGLSERIVASGSAAPPGQEESFLDRLARNAKALVDVRHVADSSANDVGSLVTRIETALANHDIEAAYKTWNQLPSGAKTASQGWGQAARARLDAVDAAKSIESDALAILGKPKT